MDERDADRALSDGRGDPADRSVTNVARGEDPGDARLHEVRIPGEGPSTFPRAVNAEVGAGEYEAPLIEGDGALEEVGVGHGAHEDEHRRRGMRRRVAARAEHDPLDAAGALHRN